MGVTNLREITKWQYKRLTKKYIHAKARNELLSEIQGYKKLDYAELSVETFERKQYLSTLSLENARMRFRVSSSFVQSVRTHFSRKYRPISLACPECSHPDARPTIGATESIPGSINQSQPRDTMTHILKCEAYRDLRGDSFDPEDDKMLAEFFTKVVQRRIENGVD